MCYRRVCGSTPGDWDANNPVLAVSLRRCRTTAYTSSALPCFTNMLLSPRPFGSRSVVRLGVMDPELRPPQVAIPSVRDTAHAFTAPGLTPSVLLRGQLARSMGTFAPVFPKARGLRLQSSSWCAQLSWAPTTMPHPTPVRTSGISLGSRFPTLHFPLHSSQVSRVHHEGLKRNGVGGVLLNAPSPLWGSPVFLQGSIRLTWSPMNYHPMK